MVCVCYDFKCQKKSTFFKPERITHEVVSIWKRRLIRRWFSIMKICLIFIKEIFTHAKAVFIKRDAGRAWWNPTEILSSVHHNAVLAKLHWHLLNYDMIGLSKSKLIELSSVSMQTICETDLINYSMRQRLTWQGSPDEVAKVGPRASLKIEDYQVTSYWRTVIRGQRSLPLVQTSRLVQTAQLEWLSVNNLSARVLWKKKQVTDSNVYPFPTLRYDFLISALNRGTC